MENFANASGPLHGSYIPLVKGDRFPIDATINNSVKGIFCWKKDLWCYYLTDKNCIQIRTILLFVFDFMLRFLLLYSICWFWGYCLCVFNRSSCNSLLEWSFCCFAESLFFQLNLTKFIYNINTKGHLSNILLCFLSLER